MRTNIVVSAIFLAWALTLGDVVAAESDIFAESKCKEAYEYHFLNRAAAFNDVLGVRYLLDGGADPNGSGYHKYIDCMGATEFSSPLMIATYNNNPLLVKILLEYGADPNLAEGEGQTSYSVARREGYTEIGRLMVEHGAN